MRRALLLALAALGCASSTGRLAPRPTDLDLVATAASACVDTVAGACEPVRGQTLRVGVTGGGEGAWLVRSLLERALLGRWSLKESATDSTAHSLDVRIVELGVRHRRVERRGVLMKPWILREGGCTLAAKLVSPSGDVLASVRTVASRPEWTPGAEISALTHPTFSPAGTVPTSPGLIAPLAVAGTVGALLALFFVTSD